MKLIFVFLGFWLAIFTTSLRAWEPFLPDLVQNQVIEYYEPLDYLEPVSAEIPKDFGIAQYLIRPSSRMGTRLILKREKGNYLLIVTEWAIREPIPYATPVLPVQRGISQKMAGLVYEMWVNALLETRYGRVGLGGRDGTTYIFSTFILSKGILNGSTWSPELDGPPKWMVETGDYLVKFCRNDKRDSAQAEIDIQKMRDRLFAYYEKKGKH